MTDPAETHPGPEAFRDLLRGRSSGADTRFIVRHLLAGCGDCGQQVEAARQEQGDPDSWSYDAAFASLERELVGAPAAPAERTATAATAVPYLRLVHSVRTGGTRSALRAAAREAVEGESQPALLRRASER